MAWIRTIDPKEASGLLKQIYDTAVKRAGKIYNIIRLQSLSPQSLKSSTQLYMDIMHAQETGLSRIQREMIATAVSRENACHY